MLLVFEASFAGQAVRVLLDTGASSSFLSAAWVENTGITTHRMKESYTVRAADGQLMTADTGVRGKLTLPTRPRDLTSFQEFKVLPLGVSVDLILGADWLSQFAPVTLYYDVWGSVGLTRQSERLVLKGRNPGAKLSERCQAMEVIQAQLLTAKRAKKDMR
jgi:hypothetical protein